MGNIAQKLKVFVFTTAYSPFIGGAEVAVEQVAKRLKDQFDFIIVTSRMRRDLPKREVMDEALVIRVGFGTWFDKFWLLIFGWLVILRELKPKKEKILFWAMDFSFGAMTACILKMIFPRIPLVFTMQYGETEKRLSNGRFGLMNLALRLILIQADFITAISSYLMRLCEKYGYIGESAIIHNGVDLKNFQFPISNFQKKSNIVITVSRLVRKNGVDVLIEAIAESKKTVPDIRLHIVGDGPERTNLEQMAGDLGVKDNIKFYGSVSYDEIPKHLAGADVFARPSRSEGMGNAFVEALAAGLPIVGTPVGGILDIIENGKTGLFAKSGDPQDLAEKIKVLLDDKELSVRIVENGRKMILERFGWDFIAKSYAQVFSKKFAVAHKILIATGLFPPDVGGPATYSKILLYELPKHGFGVRVLNFGNVKHLPKIFWHLVYGLRLIMYGRNADIIYAQDPVSVGFPSMVAAKILRKRFLLKVVGDFAWEQYEQRTNNRLQITNLEEFQTRKYDYFTEMRKRIERWTAKNAEKIIVPSEYLKKIVVKWGVPPEKIRVIYNAFDFPQGGLPDTKELVRAEFGLDGKVVVSAGRLVPWKGFGLLIEIIMDLLISFPNVKVVIIGDGPDMESLIHRARTVRENVIFTGNLPREKVLKYLIAADVFALNTAYEGLSHQILEAMSLGVPIVTTDAGGNPELIKDGESGFLIKFNDKKALADKISKLLSDKNLANLFAKNAKKKAAEFSKKGMINDIVQILNQ